MAAHARSTVYVMAIFGMLAFLLGVQFGSSLTVSAQRSKPMVKWFITGGHTEVGNRDDCAVPPLVGFGVDRIDAITNSGITVWSEAEWKQIEPSFIKTCQGRR